MQQQDVQTTIKLNDTLIEEEENDCLQNHVNQLKTLEDKTASRDQFAQQRKLLYNLINPHVHYDAYQNKLLLASQSIGSQKQIMKDNSVINSQESISINVCPNFPNTFPVTLQSMQNRTLSIAQNNEDGSDDDLEGDIMDGDELKYAGEHYERLEQMTLPVFFKNLLNKNTPSQRSPQQTVEIQPLPQFNNDQNDSHSSDLNENPNIFSEEDNSQQRQDSFFIQEDQPHQTTVPRYFDELVIFNQARRVIDERNQDGVSLGILKYLPERKIDITWIQSKGSKENYDFRKCVICLMDYKHEELVRTLPCLHYFHTECIDFWLLRSQKCPICKTRCDQFYQG